MEVYLKAYYRMNLGDDMFVKCIAERYPEVTFRVYADRRYLAAFEGIRNIKAYPCLYAKIDRASEILGLHPFVDRLLLNHSDTAVHIGGSVFIEPKDGTVFPSLTSQGDMYYIGCNFGPYRTERYLKYVYESLRSASDVCFRDSYSYGLFKELPQVRMAPDVLFGYPSYPPKKKGSGVAFSVIDPSARSGLEISAEEYYDEVAEAIRSCASEKKRVALFSFCSYEGDDRAIEKIVSRINGTSVDIFSYNGDISGFLNRLNDCECIVATRFHAMVIGWMLSKKVLPVVYSAKQTNVINDIGFTGAVRNLAKKGTRSLSELLEKYLSEPVDFDVGQLSAEAENQFCVTDRLFIK